MSVCNVGGSGLAHRLEILETNCTDKLALPNTFVLRSPKAIIHLLPGRLEVGGEKCMACWSTKGTITLKRVNKVKKSYYGGPIVSTVAHKGH